MGAEDIEKMSLDEINIEKITGFKSHMLHRIIKERGCHTIL